MALALDINTAHAGESTEIARCYFDLLAAWNNRDIQAFTALFDHDGAMVNVDGTQMIEPVEIAAVLSQQFATRNVPPYVGMIREVRFLSPKLSCCGQKHNCFRSSNMTGCQFPNCCKRSFFVFAVISGTLPPIR